MDMGVLAGNAPAPLMAIDEDDEFFLTLSNPGMIMRPDLFEQHTVHFHGYPNASSFFDGVPDASIAINIAGSFTYYYTAPDAGTYFWHCHITPPEHLQMGMVGQLYVRPRQNRLTSSQSLRDALIAANKKAAVASTATGLTCSDILCTGQTPAPPVNAATGGGKYAYNDGDGSTRYDVEVPIQMMGFDPNFHYVGMTFNPEAFADMKDKYALLNGRGYPDTVNPGAISTLSSDGVPRPSQPLPALIQINKSGGQTRALLRLSMLSVTEHVTLATVGIPMTVIAVNARLLRDLAGNNLYYNTNSITMGGGESTDVILDASSVPPGTYFLYSTNLDHLSNDAENFGGMMTEIVVQ
jgi:FtsP/CotA-like multicopper oxidase with cupredoxin domain